MDNEPPAVAALMLAIFLAAIAISCYCFPELGARMNGFYTPKDYRSMVKWLAIGSVLALLASVILFVISLVA
jgi:hypothetical protein